MNDKFDEELEQNRLAYEGLREQIRRDFHGQYVAMAFGRIVGVSPNFDEATATVAKLDPAPEHVLVFPAEKEPAWESYDSISSEYL